MEKQVSFMRAMQLFEEGKTLICRDKSGDRLTTYKPGNSGNKIIDINGMAVCSQEILHGIWYAEIEEEKEVKFKEAIEAYKNGKTIFCRLIGYKNTYCPEKKSIQPLGVIISDNYDNPITTREILEGKWYIKEEVTC